ncbi:hypothetical protein [Idiomarina sp. UBA3162]|jgi:hypothetical protein|uniref:hypothetical protein n=1 Tax=Idiomarina sp. UBA3162 TaxID=1946641 RepID=UPI000C990590|nr:hypothetical protein [Idiomarina sp. UBA3162]MAD53067.1 hypothetical protein [Idiomarinaceae bacterium]|tara:strand:+ start:155 stop:550 length:396 start_codon:yes stop_codon:yes gene_type:complete
MNVFQQQELLYQQLRQGSGYLKRAQWRDAHTVLNDAQATALELSDVSWFASNAQQHYATAVMLACGACVHLDEFEHAQQLIQTATRQFDNWLSDSAVHEARRTLYACRAQLIKACRHVHQVATVQTQKSRT